MSKVDTDQGLGPGSERRRREIAGEKSDPPPSSDSRKAETQPGIGKVERSNDTVDDLLGGFGPSRPDLPRILPAADTTPPPEPVRHELTPTQPGKRQRMRNMILVGIITFGIVAAIGVLLVKMGTNASSTTPGTTTTSPATTAQTTTTATTQSTETIAPITTLSVDALPTVARTSTSAPPPSTSKTVHSANTTATAPTSTSAATVTTAHPTGSAPPGMNLLPDDPHR